MTPKCPASKRKAQALWVCLFLMAALLPGGNLAHADETLGALTNGAQVLALSAEDAEKRLPVFVTGVVTAAEPNWAGRFFVQDSTGGVFVDNHNGTQPEVGDLVEVSGGSHPGAFAPTITVPHWKKLGTAPLPSAKIVSMDELMAGTEDGQRVEISGIVRAVDAQRSRTRLTLVSGGYRLNAYMPATAASDPQNLIGATVRVRGTAAASYNAKLRHLIMMIVYVPQDGDFVVEKSEATDPFSEVMIPLNNIAQYRFNGSPSKRVHVRGVVTYQRPGQDIFLKDETGGLHVKSWQLEEFPVGSMVEAAGFPALENFLPVLEDAVVRSTSAPAVTVTAEPVTIENLQAGFHHADFMMIEGTLLDRSVRDVWHGTNRPVTVKTTLLLQSTNLTFTAESESPERDPKLNAIPIGSQIGVSGICLTESGSDGKFKSLQVLLPTPESFRVIHEPSWWTPRRLGIALGIFFIVSVAAIGWTIVISRKNSQLNVLVREKERAQAELQNAHDHLEVRVKERTEQLKVQIAARKESEFQFKGVLMERTRLAQELHDTLEQTLASIALQLDTSAKLAPKDSAAAGHHFELARTILSQGQVDVRRSVWDLRARALEKFDLCGALIASSKQITEGTGIKADVTTRGRVRPLPEILEDNLLRITQEAVTNIIKHSRATRADIAVDYGPQTISLQITDNGVGFEVNGHVGASEGHFGLQGISERAQRLGGRAIITSARDAGTRVRVEIPVETAERIAQPELAGTVG